MEVKGLKGDEEKERGGHSSSSLSNASKPPDSIDKTPILPHRTQELLVYFWWVYLCYCVIGESELTL